MDWSSRRRNFREVLAGNRCVHPASVYDPVSARIAADLGFELGMLAGSTASLTVLGAPDLVVLTLTEFAQQALRINRAVALPLLVDADHGYGNALNVMRTVQELETAGVSALTIEDTLLPGPFGGGPARVIPMAEAVGKISAAVASREDPALVILARTSAIALAGLDAALERVRAYAALGVDGIFIVGARTRADIESVRGTTDLPLVLGTLTSELDDRDWLASRGVRIALQGHQAIQAAAAAVHATMQALREGTPPARLQGLPNAAFMRRVTRQAEYEQGMKDHLGA